MIISISCRMNQWGLLLRWWYNWINGLMMLLGFNQNIRCWKRRSRIWIKLMNFRLDNNWTDCWLSGAIVRCLTTGKDSSSFFFIISGTEMWLRSHYKPCSIVHIDEQHLPFWIERIDQLLKFCYCSIWLLLFVLQNTLCLCLQHIHVDRDSFQIGFEEFMLFFDLFSFV